MDHMKRLSLFDACALLDEMLMVFKGRRILFQTISFVGKPKRFLKVSTNELLAFGEMTSKGDIPL